MDIIRVVENDVEFFTVSETGESALSETGLARLCNVTQQSMHELIEKTVTGKTKSECLKPFLGKSYRLQAKVASSPIYTRLNLVRSDYAAAIVEYYAFESRYKTKEALFAHRKFAKMGIEQWIQSITGWSNEPIEAPLPDLTLPREAVRILKNSQETKTAYRLFLYLHDVGQQGERPTITKICKDLEISRPTFHKTAKRLQELKVLPTWFELESHNYPEHYLRDWLQSELGGQTEAPTIYGPIDLLTDGEVIEIKRIENWKDAIGHVLVKGECYPDRYKCLLLFGEKIAKQAMIRECCEKFDICIEFQHVKYRYDQNDDLIEIQRLYGKAT
jgi:hypothetical protein